MEISPNDVQGFEEGVAMVIYDTLQSIAPPIAELLFKIPEANGPQLPETNNATFWTLPVIIGGSLGLGAVVGLILCSAGIVYCMKHRTPEYLIEEGESTERLVTRSGDTYNEDEYEDEISFSRPGTAQASPITMPIDKRNYFAEAK